MEFSDKCHQIKSISDEVGKLHPLLLNVFPHLPNVRSFEYTHGQFERGADFIVEIENNTTGRRSFVGVVVKCGKVSGGEGSDVEEQIKECAEERTYQVMHRVRCTEVWVFASGGYSERAKEKLQGRFPGRNVEFFGTEDIANFIDDYYAYFWQNLPYDLGAYLQQLSVKLDILDRSSGVLMSPGTEGTYINLDTYERVEKTYVKNSRQRHSIKNIDFIHEALTTKIGLLEAEMGFGKSNLCRRLASSLCNADSYTKHKTVPIFSTYKLFLENYDGNLQELINQNLGSAVSCLEDEETKLLIILDGIDECSTPEHTSSDLFDQVLSQLKEFPRYSILISSRPLKILDDRAVLYQEARIFGIRPLSLTKIVRYLEDTCTKMNLPARLFEDLKKSPLFRQLPQSPIAAALFSNLLNENIQEVPQSLTELYSKSTELMLGRWEQKKELATEKQFKTAQVIAEQLAKYYVENRLIYVARSEIDQIITNYLKKRNIGIDKNVIDTLLFERSNMFSIDTETGTVAFRHRSFAEYLCAHHMSRDRSLVVRDAALNPYWANVFFFYAGTLLDCPEVLKELRMLKAENELQEWMKLLSVPSYLLAAYQTEFEEVESNLLVVLLETAHLFLRIKRGDTQTRLGELTEMQVLYIFKSIVVENFGYDFFSLAFEGVALGIESSLEEPEVIYYALFLLGCAALECDDESIFDFLIKSVGTKKLPISISFGIRCELETSSHLDKSGLLRFHKDKIHKMLTGKKSSTEALANRSLIKDLFTKALSVNKKEN